jgi:glucose/arabinose dehydrogenase
MRLLAVLTMSLIAGVAAFGCSSSSGSSKTPTTAPKSVPAASGVVAGAYAAQPALPQLDFGLATGLFPIPGDDGFAYLITKDGLVRRVSMTDGGATHDIVLDTRSRLITNPGQEEGLLGLAFAPDFATSRRLYLNYTAGPPREDTVSRFVMAKSGATDVATEEILLQVDDPYTNHNGGGMEFGPDGMLYIGFGDGGAGGDPLDNGQKKDALLGKLLRIDVSAAKGYTVPPDNPFAAGGGRGEVWAYGLRNPWRFDFDAATGKLWLSDVGQNVWEEVDLIVKDGNYGWNTMEGPVCFKPNRDCNQEGLILPRASYSHDNGNCSITGGYVYHGKAMPELDGWYVYGDFCSKKIWALNTADSSDPVLLTTGETGITAFGKDATGEIYILGIDGAPLKLARK